MWCARMWYDCVRDFARSCTGACACTCTCTCTCACTCDMHMHMHMRVHMRHAHAHTHAHAHATLLRCYLKETKKCEGSVDLGHHAWPHSARTGYAHTPTQGNAKHHDTQIAPRCAKKRTALILELSPMRSRRTLSHSRATRSSRQRRPSR